MGGALRNLFGVVVILNGKRFRFVMVNFCVNRVVAYLLIIGVFRCSCLKWFIAGGFWSRRFVSQVAAARVILSLWFWMGHRS